MTRALGRKALWRRTDLRNVGLELRGREAGDAGADGRADLGDEAPCPPRARAALAPAPARTGEGDGKRTNGASRAKARRGDGPEIARVAAMAPAAMEGTVRKRSTETLERWDAAWESFAHRGQLPPAGDWRTWLIMAGRGFGKTRAGAEWVSGLARTDGALRIALVAGSMDEARAVMVQGQSGLLAVGPPGERPRWEDGRGRLLWPSGAQAAVFSGQSPEALRGPEHHLAWCDELAKWARAEETWTQLQLGLRLGPHPRALVTTTPRSTPLMRALVAEAAKGDGRVVRTGGRTADNLALSDGWRAHVRARWEGTRLGRQELDGELLEDVAGALWPRALIERCRVGGDRARDERFVRVVVGVDPPAGAADGVCGIVAVGRTDDGRGLVLEDASVGQVGPAGWAARVAATAARWGADRVVAEVNQGGTMVESVLRGAAVHMPLRCVHASRGKGARAEPVAALYEAGTMHHAGAFPELEDELCGLTAAGYEGPGRSPDRADALVWAAWELFLRAGEAEPRLARI